MNFFKQNQKIILPVVVVGALIVLPLIWWLASPLWRTDAVDEAFPFEIPSETEMDAMTMEEKDEMIEDAVKQISADPTLLDNMPEEQKAVLNEQMEEVAATMPDKEMDDDMPEAENEWVAVSQGAFRDFDSFHQGTGQAAIFQQGDQRILRLENFEVTNGPDLHVLLVANPDATSSSDLGEYVDLGGLKGNVGNQNYEIPADVDLSQYSGVMIYCKPFHFVFSTAPFGN
ncbi:MAG: DM13 domain-containing protein [Candidatus Promineifilaceae bacterium]